MYHQKIISQMQHLQRNGLAELPKCSILKNLKMPNGEINSNASRNTPSPESFRLWYTPSVAQNVAINTIKLDKLKVLLNSEYLISNLPRSDLYNPYPCLLVRTASTSRAIATRE